MAAKDPGLDDVLEQAEWYCCRCERPRPIARRLSSEGITLFGALTALGLPLWAQTVPALVTQFNKVTAYVGTVIYVILIGGSIVQIMKKAGPARRIICSACESADVVPLDSLKAERALGAAGKPGAQNS